MPPRPETTRAWPRTRATRALRPQDSATGGPDVGRRIWPTIGIVDDDGARFVPDDEIAPVVDAILAGRVDNPGGAR